MNVMAEQAPYLEIQKKYWIQCILTSLLFVAYTLVWFIVCCTRPTLRCNCRLACGFFFAHEIWFESGFRSKFNANSDQTIILHISFWIIRNTILCEIIFFADQIFSHSGSEFKGNSDQDFNVLRIIFQVFLIGI